MYAPRKDFIFSDRSGSSVIGVPRRAFGSLQVRFPDPAHYFTSVLKHEYFVLISMYRKSEAMITNRPDMTSAVYGGGKVRNQIKQNLR